MGWIVGHFMIVMHATAGCPGWLGFVQHVRGCCRAELAPLLLATCPIDASAEQARLYKSLDVLTRRNKSEDVVTGSDKSGML